MVNQTEGVSSLCLIVWRPKRSPKRWHEKGRGSLTPMVRGKRKLNHQCGENDTKIPVAELNLFAQLIEEPLLIADHSCYSYQIQRCGPWLS